MIKLKEIVTSNNQLLEMKRLGAQAKKVAAQMLGKRGLENPDYFILKIKKSSDPDWVAMYIDNSIRTGRPIFWMNIDLPEIMKKYDINVNIVWTLTDNILHEWWHAIMDCFRIFKMRGVEIKVPFLPDYSRKEETDAEDFMKWVTGDAWGSGKKNEYFTSCIQEFNRLWT